jgi:hypothetical protein
LFEQEALWPFYLRRFWLPETGEYLAMVVLTLAALQVAVVFDSASGIEVLAVVLDPYPRFVFDCCASFF